MNEQARPTSRSPIRRFIRAVLSRLCESTKVRSELLAVLNERHTGEVVESLSADLRRFVGHQQITPETEKALHSYCSVFGVLAGTDVPQCILGEFERVAGGLFNYSQEGESVVLSCLLAGRESGFFVDIGAHHPIRFSNTWALYRKGWRGINIDATPGSMNLFAKLRPMDTNLECAVSDDSRPMAFHLFKEGALNTFDAAVAQTYVKAGWECIGAVMITPRPLAAVLDEHMPPGRPISLMSIDVEGQEMGVLRSNNWERYRPEVIVMEVLDTLLAELPAHPCVRFLCERGYKPVSRLFNSVIFRAEA